ncbi:MAG: hypothetical protein EA398_13720, partial [Deltaproteobacteria bacterium]
MPPTAHALRIRYRGPVATLPWPEAQEEEAAAAAGAFARSAVERVLPVILAAWDRTPPAREDAREDARTVPPPAPQELERALGGLRVLLGRFLEVDPETGATLARSARDVLRVNGAAHDRLFAQVLGVDPLA